MFEILFITTPATIIIPIMFKFEDVYARADLEQNFWEGAENFGRGAHHRKE